MINRKLDISVKRQIADPKGRYIILKVKMNQQEFVTANIYGPNFDDREFFEKVLAEVDSLEVHQKNNRR